MEELHIERLATHGDPESGDPESCVASREGGGEALTGTCAGRAIEPRKERGRGAHTVPIEKHSYDQNYQQRQHRYFAKVITHFTEPDKKASARHGDSDNAATHSQASTRAGS